MHKILYDIWQKYVTFLIPIQLVRNVMYMFLGALGWVCVIAKRDVCYHLMELTVKQIMRRRLPFA